MRYILFVCEQIQKAKVKGDTANTTKDLIKSVVERKICSSSYTIYPIRSIFVLVGINTFYLRSYWFDIRSRSRLGHMEEAECHSVNISRALLNPSPSILSL